MRSLYQPPHLDLPQRSLGLDQGAALRLVGGCLAQADASAMNPSIESLLAPLLDRAAQADSPLRFSTVGVFHHGACRYHLPRFIFQGPPGGGQPLRLGVFAAIHGDEPEGALALQSFLLQLADEPALAHGYEIYAYPLCNPSGFEDRTRHSRAGRDLNREFWSGSPQPEVYFLERELGVQQFAGLISLHSDDTADGAYAYVRGATLTEALAKPALAAAAEFLPLAAGAVIDGFPARAALISDCYQGVLSNPAELRPLPFEIIFETPQSAPPERQRAAGVAALRAILREYRQFLAYGQDL